ncbi:MAG: hypothetical protein JSU66_06865 [Deltaproteobacteria bacterium]|nr:MAG: hypothetical protein JSU66_06865 [Deltaproteobacteria bacterium]
MSNPNETIRGDRNLVERIVQLVPGFRGYYDRENRREADQLIRKFGVSKLDQLIAELHELTKNAPLREKDDYQECVNQAEKLRNALQYADRGYSGFFSEVKWDRPERLAALYERDEQIVALISTLAESLVEGGIPLPDLRAELILLQRTVEERRDVILNLGSA